MPKLFFLLCVCTKDSDICQHKLWVSQRRKVNVKAQEADPHILAAPLQGAAQRKWNERLLERLQVAARAPLPKPGPFSLAPPKQAQGTYQGRAQGTPQALLAPSTPGLPGTSGKGFVVRFFRALGERRVPLPSAWAQTTVLLRGPPTHNMNRTQKTIVKQNGNSGEDTPWAQ